MLGLHDIPKSCTAEELSPSFPECSRAGGVGGRTWWFGSTREAHSLTGADTCLHA